MRYCEAPFPHRVGSNTYIQKVYAIFTMMKRFASSAHAFFLLKVMTQKVYTDADLFDPKILRQASEDITTIQNCLNNNHIHLSDSIVLVLDVFYAEAEGEEPGRPSNNKSIQTIYHLADHQQRVIFFLDDVEASDLHGCYEIQNVTSETHLRKNCYVKYLVKVLMASD